MKFVITNTISVNVDTVEEAEEILKNIQNNISIIQDSDTKLVSIDEGIEDKDKIHLNGYFGVKITTCVGHKIGTKYGQTYTVKDWDSDKKTLGFEETDDRLHESRISTGSYVYEEDEY